MLLTVESAAAKSLDTLATEQAGDLATYLQRNDRMRFQIQNLDTNDIYLDIYATAAIANGTKIVAGGGKANFTARTKDVSLIAETSDATDVRIIAESIEL